MNTELATQIAATHEKSIAKVKEMTTQIGKAISESIDKDNPDELMGKLQELTSLQANASYCLAMSEMLYDEKIAQLVEEEQYQKLSATDKKMLFQGKAKLESYYVKINERYSRSLTHSIESIRSILSFKKSEMELSRYQTT